MFLFVTFHLWGLLLIGYVSFRVCRLLSLSPMGFVAHLVCRSIQNGLSPLDPGLTCSLFSEWAGHAKRGDRAGPAQGTGPHQHPLGTLHQGARQDVHTRPGRAGGLSHRLQVSRLLTHQLGLLPRRPCLSTHPATPSKMTSSQALQDDLQPRLPR